MLQANINGCTLVTWYRHTIQSPAHVSHCAHKPCAYDVSFASLPANLMVPLSPHPVSETQ